MGICTERPESIADAAVVAYSDGSILSALREASTTVLYQHRGSTYGGIDADALLSWTNVWKMLSLLFTFVVAGLLGLEALRYHSHSIDIRVSLLLAALFYLAVKIYHVLIYPFAVSPLRHLPTPKDTTAKKSKQGNLILGQTIKQFTGGSPHAAPVNWMRQFPDADLIRPLMLGNSEIVLVNSPRALREVSQTHCYSFVKPGFLFRTAGEFIGETGVFFAEGEAHKHQRRILAVSSFLAKATLDVIGKTVLGYELDSLTQTSEFDQRYIDVMHLSSTDQIMLALNNWFPARKWIPIQANRRFLDGNRIIKQMLEEHIKQRVLALSVETYTEKVLEGDDLLTMTIRGYLDRGEPFCEDQLVSQVRLRSAINAAIREQTYTYETVQSIDYLDFVVKEVLRLFPPFVSVLRTASEDISICGNIVPAGTLLMIYPAVSQLNPSIWGTTVNDFDPDRWYNLPEAAQDPYVFQTFHSGPRVCIGRAFALLEIKVFLIQLLRKWAFHPVERVINIPKTGFALKPTDGLKLRVTPAPLS
ncbi:cytochrome P450 3A9 [Microsporum canis CBS 113480]|uniref:Cytochrome P450 3A9 n=1 Tax=Arthroderma otae (strain ATCC MYA-4605 / CBS 113480) TaxID=554155 RepID=C5FCY6_ARTOC|nr:cytochrome P450 3A9 [Microsporum canis CBS 113480]EEQ27670.1 cytochrome P450 3A9 [Microsporum canis CBS 113480]